MSAAQDVVRYIRQAAAHEDAAGRHEDKYEQQMKSAGASMYEAFTLALRAVPEFKGRQIDDKAIGRIYKSTKPRPWWDAHLKAASVIASTGKGDRERAARLIQWHVDPSGAAGRRAQHALKEAARRKTLDKQSRGKTHGARVHRESGRGNDARMERHAGRITEAAMSAATGGRAPAAMPESAAELSLEDMLGDVNRINVAVRKVKPEHRAPVSEALKVTAREVERYL